MANGRDDIRLCAGMPDHIKSAHLIELLGYEGFYRLVRLWCRASIDRTDGVLRSRAEVEFLAGWTGTPGAFVDALVSCGWLEADGVTLHDWPEEQPFVLNRASRSAASARAARVRWDAVRNPVRNARRNAEVMRTAMPPPSLRREESDARTRAIPPEKTGPGAEGLEQEEPTPRNGAAAEPKPEAFSALEQERDRWLADHPGASAADWLRSRIDSFGGAAEA